MPEEVSQVSTVPLPVSTAEALGMLRAAMGFLNAADAAQMAAEEQARCLQALEQVNSMGTAARASILAAFTAGQGYCARRGLQPPGLADQPDPDHQGRRGRPTPAWARRAASHPPDRWQALAAGEVSESIARTICQWTDKLPRGLPGQQRTRSWSLRPRPGWTCGTWPELAGEIYALCPAPGTRTGQGPGSGAGGPVGAAGDHVRRRRGVSTRRRSARRW